MSKLYTVELDGKRYKIKGGDVPPTEQDVRGLIGNISKSQEPSISSTSQSDLGFGNIQKKLNQPLPERPNPFIRGAQAVEDLKYAPDGLSGVKQRAGTILKVLGAPYQAAISTVSNAMLEGQKSDLRDFLSPRNTVNYIKQGVTGPERTLGDVNYRAGLNRPTADATAIAQELLLTAPELVEGSIKGGVGLVKGGINKISPMIEKTSKKLLIGDRPKVDVLNQIRKSFQAVPVQARENFADDLIRLNNEKLMMGQNPSISVKSMIDSIQADKSSEELAPIVERVIDSIPQLKKMIKNPSLADNLTLADSQNLLNSVKSALSNSKLGGVGNRPTDIPIYEDLINEIVDAQLSVHPEFSNTKKVFGDIMEKYKFVKGKIGIGLEKNMLNKFGGSESNLAASELLQNNPEVLSKIRNFRNVKLAKDIFKKAAGLTAAGAIGGAIGGPIIRKLFPNP